MSLKAYDILILYQPAAYKCIHLIKNMSGTSVKVKHMLIKTATLPKCFQIGVCNASQIKYKEKASAENMNMDA